MNRLGQLKKEKQKVYSKTNLRGTDTETREEHRSVGRVEAGSVAVEEGGGGRDEGASRRVS